MTYRAGFQNYSQCFKFEQYFLSNTLFKAMKVKLEPNLIRCYHFMHHKQLN